MGRGYLISTGGVYECALALVSLSQVCVKTAVLAGARLLVAFGAV